MKEQKAASEGKEKEGKILEQQEVGTKQILNPSPDPLQLILTKITSLETVKQFLFINLLLRKLR